MANKEMVFLKGFAKGSNFPQTRLAITAATKLHEGQMRKSGNPYIDHPMRVTSELVAMKVDDDETLAMSLLHDVIEDCNITEQELMLKYRINQTVAHNVVLLTKVKGMSTEYYYSRLRENVAVILGKGADRVNNVSTMIKVFTLEKLKSYVEETETYVLPLLHYGKDTFPEFGDQFFLMKYHIESVCEVVKAFVEFVENNKLQEPGDHEQL